ncbi:MAG: hypothetical protein Q9164_001267 [Protoblastenia rupestris]
MGNPKTPSKKSTKDKSPTKSATTRTSGIADMSELLRANNIIIYDRIRETEFPKLKALAEMVINEERNSVMKAEVLEQLFEDRETLRTANEHTFIDMFWFVLTRHVRKVKKDKEVKKGKELESVKPHVNLDEMDEWYEKAWRKDGLEHRRSASFFTDSVPVVNTFNDPHLERLLEKLPKVKLPWPDLTYGLRKEAFTLDERNVNLAYKNLTSMPSGLYHPFFIVEFKSGKGALIEAEYQACAGGAALVNAMHKLKAIAGIDDKTPGPKTLDIAFSLAITPDVARFFIHSATMTTEKKLFFHMHRVSSYVLDEEKSLKQLRNDIDNILDWGTVDRKYQVKELLKNIMDNEKEDEEGEDGEEEEDSSGDDEDKLSKA